MKIVIPLGAFVLTVSVDVHKNRLEIEWEGWGRGEENWRIDHVVIPGEVQDNAVWTELHRELCREFQHAIGCPIGLSLGLVDGSKWPDWVYLFLCRLAGRAVYRGDPLPGSSVRGKIRACRGFGGPLDKGGMHPVVNPNYTSLARNLKGHWVGTDAAKDLIYTRARLEQNEDGSFPDGYQHFPKHYSQEFIKQMFSERVHVEYVNGQEIRRYRNPLQARNEGLDLSVYNLAAFRLRRWNFDAIEADLKRQAEALKQSKGVEDRQPKPSQPRRRNNLVRSLKSGGW